MPGIGQQLKQARESRSLSIKQVVQATRIRAHYLEAMEADDFSAMPSAAQARGFLRSYAEFLGLNADDLIHRQRNDIAPSAEFTTPAQAELAAAEQPASAAEVPEPQFETLSEAAPELERAHEPEPELTGKEEVQDAAEAEAPDSPSDSQLIFVEIGNKLRQRRELLSLTLDEIERHTHVRKYYLELIEAGSFDELPSPVQARGMLSNYSSFLDMDTEGTLLRFADALQARRLERQAGLPQAPASSRRRFVWPIWLRRFVSPDLIFGGGMILLLFILTLWGAARIFSGETGRAVETQVPSIPDALLASPVVTLARTEQALPTSVEVNVPAGDGETQTPTETPLAGDGSLGLKVTLSAVERTFIRVTVDGVVEYDGRVLPGYAQTFDGQQRIEVLTGSGSAIQVLFDERNLGPMGNFGQVVNLVYTLSGIQTPTLIPSPSPTNTTTPTMTPRFQRTITPTPTATLPPTETLEPTPTALPTDSQ